MKTSTVMLKSSKLAINRAGLLLCALLLASPSATAEPNYDDLIKAGQYAQALPLLDKEIKKGVLTQHPQMQKALCLQKLNRWDEAEGPLMMVGIQKDLTGDRLYQYCLLKIEQDKHFHQDAAIRQTCDCLISIDEAHADKWKALKKAYTKSVKHSAKSHRGR